MSSTPTRRVAGLAAALALTNALIVTTALAGPPKKGKPSGATLIAAGKQVYDINRCAVCHSINGKGGKVGSSLTHEGKDPKHTAKWLETAITKPTEVVPGSTMPSFGDKIRGEALRALVAYLGSLK